MLMNVLKDITRQKDDSKTDLNRQAETVAFNNTILQYSPVNSFPKILRNSADESEGSKKLA